MKKTFLFSLGLIVAFSVMFISCDDNPGNNLGENTGIPCEINIVATEGGDVQFNDYVGTSKHVYTGTNVTVIAVADGGYAFLGWYIVGSSEKLVCNTASYTFAAKGDLQLVAKFGKLQDIAIASSDGGIASFKDSEEKIVHLLPGEDVTVVAVPDEKYDFLGWFIGDSQEPVSTEVTYTFAVSENVSLVAKFKKRVNYNGYEYVDLGLSSGTMWAAYNVGATKPEEYGGYYAWGEIEEKSNYDWSTYKWCNGSEYTMTKYCIDSSSGTVDSKTVLDLEDDVAHVKWGGDWRMPTKDEQYELCKECTWEWTTLNGVNGYRVTGPNGNSIFLPAAGYRYGTDVYDRGGYGNYWSSSLLSYSSIGAYDLYFCGYYYYYWYIDDRCDGRSVRPVSK